MKCHRLYLIADFENFSPDTLKMAAAYSTVSVNRGYSAAMCEQGVQCGNV